MSDSRVTFIETSMQRYDVYLDGKTHIGEVFYKETRYNLRRLIVTRQWIARNLNGVTVASESTRRDATRSLVINHEASA